MVHVMWVTNLKHQHLNSTSEILNCRNGCLSRKRALLVLDSFARDTWSSASKRLSSTLISCGLPDMLDLSTKELCVPLQKSRTPGSAVEMLKGSRSGLFCKIALFSYKKHAFVGLGCKSDLIKCLGVSQWYLYGTSRFCSCRLPEILGLSAKEP